MTTNPLKLLGTLGQSIWIDYIQRDLITSGKLRQLIEEDGLRGMTSNPSIFEKAIIGSHSYDDEIRIMNGMGKSAKDIYEALSQQDVQSAADEFRPLFDLTHGRDGYVSLEVNPHLAHDTHGTINEARQLWNALNRPNVFIKIPATDECLPAIRQLISEGININVTLLFGLPRYRQVIETYLSGLEMRSAQGKAVDRVASVASFFISRIDALVDPLLSSLITKGGKRAELIKAMRAQVAIASARMAYQIYKEVFNSDRFIKLAAQGAHSQRLLWASTSTKNPDFSDVKYVEALIGPDTVNTTPIETINAYRDHGEPQSRLENDVAAAASILKTLPELGVNMDGITTQLEKEGVDKFIKPFDKLLSTISQNHTKA